MSRFDRIDQQQQQKYVTSRRRNHHRPRRQHQRGGVTSNVVIIATIGLQFFAVLLDDTINYCHARPVPDDQPHQQGDDVLFSATNIQPRIIGGTETVVGRFPYHVSLLDDLGGHTCGGTLIAPDVVLTAAHCDVLNKAQIGRYDRSDPFDNFEEFKIMTQIVHPAYSPTFFTHDVMLLKLEGPSTFPLVVLNSDPDLPATEDGSNGVTAVGFGVTEYDEETGATNGAAIVLQTVELKAITNEQCGQRNDLTSTDPVYQQGYQGLISDDMLCADGAGDTCLGDSGGPLIVRYLEGSRDVQVGITSWGFGCGQDEFPGVYARVSDHMAWIEQGVCSMSSNPPSSFRCDEVMTTTPPGKQRQITIIIQFDDFPAEVGWNLVDDTGFGVLVDEKLPGSYSSEPMGSTVYETLNVTEGSSYSLTMLDTANDGLCCFAPDTVTEGPGWYLVVHGTDETGEVLVKGTGTFENGVKHSFTVRATTDAPSLSPFPTGFPSSSIAPSFAPSSVPTFNPTVTPVPTSTPSVAPSDLPSLSPTMSPSAIPSLRPSLSFAPSVSDMPSEAPSTSSASKQSIDCTVGVAAFLTIISSLCQLVIYALI